MILSLKNRSEISRREMTPEGFLLAPATLARAGVYEYAKSEIPTLPDKFKALDRPIRVLYPKSVLFSAETLGGIDGLLISDDHPVEMVSAKNYRYLSRGVIRGGVSVSGEFLEAQALIQDEELISKILNGKKSEISTGLRGELDWETGEDTKYGPYDGIFRSIRINHIAIVTHGRAGSAVKIANSKEIKMTEKVRLINGISVDFSEQGAQAIDFLQNELDKNKLIIADLSVAGEKVETLSGELAATQANLKNALEVDIDALVSARVDLINAAKVIFPAIDVAGKSDHEIKKESITFCNANFDLTSRSEAYVSGIFDTLVVSQQTSAQRATPTGDAIKNARSENTNLADSARIKFIEHTRKMSEGRN